MSKKLSAEIRDQIEIHNPTGLLYGCIIAAVVLYVRKNNDLTKSKTHLVVKTGVWSMRVLLYRTVKWSPSFDSLGQWSGLRIIPTDKWSLSCSAFSWAKAQTSKPAIITKPENRGETISSSVKGNTESFTQACKEFKMSSERSRPACERSKIQTRAKLCRLRILQWIWISPRRAKAN